MSELEQFPSENDDAPLKPTRYFVAGGRGQGAAWECQEREDTWRTLECKSADVRVSASTKVMVLLIADYPSHPDSLLVTLDDRDFFFQPLALDVSGTITSALYLSNGGSKLLPADERIYGLLTSSVGGTELLFSSRFTRREREGLVLLAAAARSIRWKASHRKWYCDMQEKRDTPECLRYFQRRQY